MWFLKLGSLSFVCLNWTFLCTAFACASRTLSEGNMLLQTQHFLCWFVICSKWMTAKNKFYCQVCGQHFKNKCDIRKHLKPHFYFYFFSSFLLGKAKCVSRHTWITQLIKKTSREKKPKGDHSFQKRGGVGPGRYDHDHRFNGFYFWSVPFPSLLIDQGSNDLNFSLLFFLI